MAQGIKAYYRRDASVTLEEDNGVYMLSVNYPDFSSHMPIKKLKQALDEYEDAVNDLIKEYGD